MRQGHRQQWCASQGKGCGPRKESYVFITVVCEVSPLLFYSIVTGAMRGNACIEATHVTAPT
jgi:hypothetical protein